MARPRIFVSSTYYDLKHLRSSLENFIESLGYDSVLSEKGDIAYLPDVALDESCYREVRNTDMFVLIVGGRYGAERSESRGKLPKSFFERYDSITKGEYQSALEKDIPIFVLIEKTVYSDFETYLKNKNNKTIDYAHSDSVNIFHLIEEILAQPRNNAIQQFDKYIEIEQWLKEQWAGLFRDMLTRSSGQRQIASLASQVGELAEVNKTLKNYLEEVVSKIAPKEAAGLIATESKRLDEARQLADIATNPLGNYLIEGFGVPAERIRALLLRARSFEEFSRMIPEVAKGKVAEGRIRDLFVRSHKRVVNDLNQMRVALGLPVWVDERHEGQIGVDESADEQPAKRPRRKVK